jgi:uncharacterized Fe-S center protein
MHLNTAIQNGFGFSSVGRPLVAAGGLRGKNGVKIPVKEKVLKETIIAKEIVEADALIAVSHVKGHELSGFGGALKNLGMGCATRKGKLVRHSTVAPKMNPKMCKRCKTCITYCPTGAISVGGANQLSSDRRPASATGNASWYVRTKLLRFSGTSHRTSSKRRWWNMH